MGAELKRAMAGGAPGAARVGDRAAADPLGESGELDADYAGTTGRAGAAGASDDPLADDDSGRLESEINAAARAGRRARLEQEADDRLAELKRRMGK